MVRILGSRLRPGVHVLRRDDGHVQVGLDPPERVILPVDPPVLSVLDALRAGDAPIPDADPSGTLHALAAAGLLEQRSPVAAGPRPSAPRVAVDPGRLDLGPLAGLLADAGIGVGADPAEPGRPPDVQLVADTGPLARARVDQWLAEDAPHLVLAGTGRPGSLRLGPFVQPGRTACLRCVDAHEATLDPRRQLLVEQLSELPPAPVDPLVVALACAWAARDLATYLAGRRPTTWSATVDLDAEQPVVRRWERHPWCGCAWDLAPY